MSFLSSACSLLLNGSAITLVFMIGYSWLLSSESSSPSLLQHLGITIAIFSTLTILCFLPELIISRYGESKYLVSIFGRMVSSEGKPWLLWMLAFPPVLGLACWLPFVRSNEILLFSVSLAVLLPVINDAFFPVDSQSLEDEAGVEAAYGPSEESEPRNSEDWIIRGEQSVPPKSDRAGG